MDAPPLVEVTAWLFPVLALAGSIAVFIKLRGTAAGILGGIGFLVIAVVQAVWTLWWRQQYERGSLDGLLEWLYEIRFPVWAPWLRLVAYGLLVAGFLTVPRRGFVGTGFAQGTGEGRTPPPHRVPGWGVATGWIVTSSLSTAFALLFLAFLLEAGSHISSSEEDMLILFGVLTALLAIPAVILFCVWLYQAWDSVPPAYRSTTPGKAVGLIFVPLFNLYWIFRALPGLSGSIARAHRAVDDQTIGSPGYGLGIAACVLAVIPYVDAVAWVLVLIWLCVTNAARNRMLEAYRRNPAQASPAASPM